MFVVIFIKREWIDNNGRYKIVDVWTNGPFETYGESMSCIDNVKLDGSIDFYIKELNENKNMIL